ncbi:hypothetical protein N658DRAFT_241162 [Parathielavia hyrcaniae]|uniref:Uncharacterized protein n=1 Tax=Parathielavia hyrcaniae TaxID=113614 RepID=A0AAN6Q5Q0_9PEZI|nr:hypothetical protein N658DRAFT_241162 [Parathielavia hyrcaniae]
MTTRSRPQRTAARRTLSGPHRRVRIAQTANNDNNSSRHQLPAQISGGSHCQQSQGNQGLPFAVNSVHQKKKRKLSWLCCGSYSRAAAIWGCLAVASPLAFFFLEWFKPQDDAYAKGVYEEQRYQSDVETTRLCVELKAAQLPWSHLGLDCDQILRSPLPTRRHIDENMVAQVARTPSKVQAGLLAILKLVWGLQNTNSLFTALSTCILACVVAWLIFAGRRSPASFYGWRQERLWPAVRDSGIEALQTERSGSRTGRADSRPHRHDDPSSDAEASPPSGDRGTTVEGVRPSSDAESPLNNNINVSGGSTTSEGPMDVRSAPASNRKAANSRSKLAATAAVAVALKPTGAAAAAAPKRPATPSTTTSSSPSTTHGQSSLLYPSWAESSSTRSAEPRATEASALPSATMPSTPETSSRPLKLQVDP